MSRQKKPYPDISWGWRTMWVFALFDLPTETSAQRKAYAKFRKQLLDDGFTMMQYSVYMRHCASVENAETHIDRLSRCVPALGEVRFMTITDKQFSKIRVFTGKKRQKTPPTPVQLELF